MSKQAATSHILATALSLAFNQNLVNRDSTFLSWDELTEADRKNTIEAMAEELPKAVSAMMPHGYPSRASLRSYLSWVPSGIEGFDELYQEVKANIDLLRAVSHDHGYRDGYQSGLSHAPKPPRQHLVEDLNNALEAQKAVSADLTRQLKEAGVTGTMKDAKVHELKKKLEVTIADRDEQAKNRQHNREWAEKTETMLNKSSAKCAELQAVIDSIADRDGPRIHALNTANESQGNVLGEVMDTLEMKGDDRHFTKLPALVVRLKANGEALREVIVRGRAENNRLIKQRNDENARSIKAEAYVAELTLKLSRAEGVAAANANAAAVARTALANAAGKLDSLRHQHMEIADAISSEKHLDMDTLPKQVRVVVARLKDRQLLINRVANSLGVNSENHNHIVDKVVALCAAPRVKDARPMILTQLKAGVQKVLKEFRLTSPTDDILDMVLIACEASKELNERNVALEKSLSVANAALAGAYELPKGVIAAKAFVEAMAQESPHIDQNTVRDMANAVMRAEEMAEVTRQSQRQGELLISRSRNTGLQQVATCAVGKTTAVVPERVYGAVPRIVDSMGDMPPDDVIEGELRKLGPTSAPGFPWIATASLCVIGPAIVWAIGKWIGA